MESSPPRSQRVDRRFLARLPAEVESWQAEGIITPEQGQAIMAGYPAPLDPAAARRPYGRLVTILATLGSLLIGLGVILFVASNWGEIPRAARLGLILGIVAIAYAVGYWLRYGRGYQRVGTAVILLAALCYGAAIHLVAQVYHFPLNDPNLFLFWFLGVLPLAYLTRSRAILSLALLLFLGAVGFRLPSWLENVRDFAYSARVVILLYLAVGAMLYTLGRLQAQFRQTETYARVYEIVGLITAFGALYMFTFRDFFPRQGSTASGGDVATELWWTLHSAAALAVAALAVSMALARRGRLLRQTLPYEGATAVVLLVAGYAGVYLPFGGNVAYPLLFNLLLFLGIVGLIFAGYFRGDEVLINLALVFFGVGIVSRYFEYSWELFDRSLVFVVAGVILLGGGFLLEWSRRRVLARMRPQEGGT